MASSRAICSVPECPNLARYARPYHCTKHRHAVRTTVCKHEHCDRVEYAKSECRYHYDKQFFVADNCDRCGTAISVEPNRRQRYVNLYCGKQCREQHQHGFTYASSKEVALYIPLPQRRKTERKPLVFIAGRCAVCCELFVTTTARARTCGSQCASALTTARKKASRYRRRMRLRAARVAPVIPAQIFERDNYLCHLCDMPVVSLARVPTPAAPTLDHVIPLALGGEHSPDNVRTAHFTCNSVRRDMPVEEARRLLL